MRLMAMELLPGGAMRGGSPGIVPNADRRQRVHADGARDCRHPGIGGSDASPGWMLWPRQSSGVRSPRVNTDAGMSGNVESQDAIRSISPVRARWMRVWPHRVLERMGAVRRMRGRRVTVHVVECRPRPHSRSGPVPERDLVCPATEGHRRHRHPPDRPAWSWRRVIPGVKGLAADQPNAPLVVDSTPDPSRPAAVTPARFGKRERQARRKKRKA